MAVILPAADVPGAAQESTSQDILAAVDGLESGVAALATEATATGIESQLTTLNAVDFATSTKQDSLEGKVDTLIATDFATETTLNTLSGVVSARLGGSFTPFPYDYMSFDGSGSDSDIYAFYLGGPGGSLQGTVTVQYTDATKETIANVTTVAGS